ncbi:MAG: hypothetical protein ACR2OC_09825 [Solirubrobacterales bacterium]
MPTNVSSSRTRLRRTIILVLVVATATVVAIVLLRSGDESEQRATSVTPFELGFADSVYLADEATRAAWLDRTAELGADLIGVQASWDEIAPLPPQDPTSPSSAGYEFEALDGAITAAAARGLDVVVQLNQAPRWAEGPNRDPSAPPATWKPSPAALAEFATALGRRYSGEFDPSGGTLPAVELWQIWGEPNLSTNLTPQWEAGDGGDVPFSPVHYRAMLNGAYRALNEVNEQNFVVSAGTGPFGDAAEGGERLQPASFWREVFCLDAELEAECTASTSLDALAHDPYSVGGPFRRALNDDDVSVADMGKLGAILEAAQETGHTEPASGQELWVTEVSWDSRPPDPDGVPEERHAEWLADAFQLFWHTGVDRVLWFQVRDAAPEPSAAASYQSGVFQSDGSPKPAARAFRFPFSVSTKDAGEVEVWGRAPSAGEVTIERVDETRSETIASFETGASNVFHGGVPANVGEALRAAVGAERSIVRRVR